MNCKICGSKMTDGWESFCPTKPSFDWPLGHYSYTDKGHLPQHYFKKKESCIIDDLHIINVEYLTGEKECIVIEHKNYNSNAPPLYKIASEFDIDDLKKMSKNEIIEKLETYKMLN